MASSGGGLVGPCRGVFRWGVFRGFSRGVQVGGGGVPVGCVQAEGGVIRWEGVQRGGREKEANVRGVSLTESFCNLNLGLEMD